MGRGGVAGDTFLVWRMVIGSPMVEHRSKLSFPQSRGGISESKLGFSVIYPFSLRVKLRSTTLAFMHPQAVPTAAKE